MNHKNIDIIFLSHELLKQLGELSEEKNKHKKILQEISIINDDLKTVKSSKYSIRCQIAYRKAYSYIKRNREALQNLYFFIKKEIALAGVLGHGFKRYQDKYDMQMSYYGFPNFWTQDKALFDSYSSFEDIAFSISALKAMLNNYVDFWSSVGVHIENCENSLTKIKDYMKIHSLDKHEIVYQELSYIQYVITNNPGSYYYELVLPMHDCVYRFYHPSIKDFIRSHSYDTLFRAAITRSEEQAKRKYLA